MSKGYNIFSSNSIINFAKKLKGLSLREACGSEINQHGYSGKGNFGQLLEKFYFGYEPNSNTEPDFPEVGIELKSSPLKTLLSGEFKAKERLVLNIINYLEVHQESFRKSSFWKKNSHLLLVFYLHDTSSNLLDYKIHLVDHWRYPPEDLEVIKNDWEIINQKIKDGRAHELSEGDTFYLGACTKGASAKKSLREQPYNSIKAKQRAYSLKTGYVNHIIANISGQEKNVYGRIIKNKRALSKKLSIEQFVVSKFKPFYGKSSSQIENELGLRLNKKSKSYFADITNGILGVELGKKIEEFEKADIQVKTVRLFDDDLPKESISFPAFKYDDLIVTDWEDSDFKHILESKFFFVFYKVVNDNLVLRKVMFWNMSKSDLNEAKKVWDKTKEIISKGRIVRKVVNSGTRYNYFPKIKENKVSHVRPHARNAADTYPLPVPDILTGDSSYTKHSFWLNARYIRDEVYLK